MLLESEVLTFLVVVRMVIQTILNSSFYYSFRNNKAISFCHDFAIDTARLMR